MSKYVKETILGTYKEVPGGYSDPDCTHVILTLKEYNKILGEKDEAVRGKADAIDQANRQIRNTQNNADYQIKQAKQEIKQQLESLEEELAKERSSAEFQRDLNANLLRISRERANAERKLRPKKEHTGYVVVSSTEKEYRYKITRKEFETVTLWETVIQSPYTVDFTEDEAKKLIAEDLAPRGRAWLVGKIGITGSYPGKYEEMLRDTKTDSEFMQRNVMLSRSLRANFRAGYWETFFLHTKPLGIVPVDMRAR